MNIDETIEDFEKFVKTYKGTDARTGQINAIKALFEGNINHSKFLFNLCCGAGKTIIEAYLIFKEIRDCEQNNKKARIMIASHRLLLNTQLVNILYSALDTHGIKNIDWYSLSSATSFKIGNRDFPVSKFTKESIDSINCSDKHIIIVACAVSEKNHFGKNDSDTMISINEDEDEEKVADIINVNTTKHFLNLIIQDELHKDIPTRVLENFEKISEKIYGFTATPSNNNKKWFGRNIFKYSFSQALKDNIVVKAKLYVSQLKYKTKIYKKIDISNIIASFDHLQNDLKNTKQTPIFLNYLSSVDHLVEYGESIKKEYGEKVNVAIFSSTKMIPDEKNGTKIVSECKWNGKSEEKENLLSKCQKNEVGKPLIILSAFMIVEGIDIPNINGVGIWCEKNDANMFQAACRGCRTSTGKTYYNIYTTEELVKNTSNFIEKLYNGFDGELDFGDGQSNCTGTGKKENGKKSDCDGFIIVNPKAIKPVLASIKEIEVKYKEKIVEEEKNEKFNEVLNEISKIDTLGKRWDFVLEQDYLGRFPLRNQEIIDTINTI